MAMDIDYVVIADGVISAGGKHYIHGGGWDSLFAGSFPVTHPQLGVAVRLRVGWHDTNQNHVVVLDVQDADNHSILPSPITGNANAGRPSHIPNGEDQVFCLAFTLGGLTFPKEGDYAFVVMLDGAEKCRQVVHVRTIAGPPMMIHVPGPVQG